MDWKFTLSLLAMVVAFPVINMENFTYEKFLVDSVIVSRYARTTITNILFNPGEVSKEVSFQVKLPFSAFISNFTMEVNGTTYVGLADEKEKAEKEFEERKQSGENVGLVQSSGSNVFLIRINTAADSRSTFVLTYEELLIRTLSKYQQIIALNPGGVVEDLRVTVHIIDSQGIKIFNGSQFVTSNRISNDEVRFSYSPSKSQQNDESTGISKNVIVEYDVNHPTDGSAGLIIINDCYFAQFFSPGGISTIPVDIVFVIDTSGSMSGTKIKQARESLVEIIRQLSSKDRFTIVVFSTRVNTWKSSLVSVSEFREEGKKFASDLNVDGGTNFAGGLERGINILKDSGTSDYVQLLVMLSDGEPTEGITDHDMIVNKATNLVSETRISLNMLGFGTNLNFLLLQRLAIANRGIAKQIFEGNDATGQLEGFYRSISSPILHSLNFSLPSNYIEAITEMKFPLLFEGSEVVVAGKFNESACISGRSIPVNVSGRGISSVQTFSSIVNLATQTTIAGIAPDTERLVAYLTIQQLLNDAKISRNPDDLKRKALNLALQYNFVTELTSLLVVEESLVDDVVNGNLTSEFSLSDDVQKEGDSLQEASSGFSSSMFNVVDLTPLLLYLVLL